MRLFLSLFQSFDITFWKLLQWSWFVLRLQAQACNFFRTKLHRRHFSRKVLMQTAFLFALFQSFCETLLKWLLWSSFLKRLKEVPSNFCRNELLCADTFFETSWRQSQLFYFVSFKAFGEVFRVDDSGTLFKKVTRDSICNCSRNEPHHEHFHENVTKEKATYFIFFLFKTNGEILWDDCSGILF